MNLDNLKKSLNINGWAKFKIKDYEKFTVLQNHIIEELKKNQSIKEEFNKQNISSVMELRQKSSSLSDKIVNLIRKEYIDDLSFQSIDCFRDYIIPLFGNKLLSQKFPQIQINIPSNNSTITPPHTEVMSGHSPYTYNFWIPLHKVEGNSGLYLVDLNKSINICDMEIQGKIKSRYDFLKEYLFFPEVDDGEALIFNGFIYHGSVSHKFKKSRFSIDLRLQSLDKPLFHKFNEYFKIIEI
jgi:sporadic carbohydrate cluster 2OG-Fe(II) oxygenase